MLSELDQHRIAWEHKHGPVDVTKYYTSRWPIAQQNALYAVDFKAYFDGLPPFLQSFLRDKVSRAAHDGKMDDMPSEYIRLYCLNQMKGPGDQSRFR